MRETSPESFQNILIGIANGLKNEDACAYAGVSRSVFYQKLKDDPDYSDSYEKALVSFKLKHLRRIEQASEDPKNWTASAWILERKFKEEFSRMDRMDLTTKGQPIRQIKTIRLKEIRRQDDKSSPDKEGE